MDVRIDGDRSSAENWTRAQMVPSDQLPALSEAQRTVAAKLHLSAESYARSVYAGELERRELEKRAEAAGRLIESLAVRRVPGARLERVWWKTFDGKLRFDLSLRGSEASIVVAEPLIEGLLDGSVPEAEEQLARLVARTLPANWLAQVS
jgi:hypothetical protein